MENNRVRWRYLFFIVAAVGGQVFLTQKNSPWTLVPGMVLFLTAILLFAKSKQIGPRDHGSRPLSTGMEAMGLAVVAVIALFFRFYRWSEIPPGLITETACGPWLGYAVPPSFWGNYYTHGLALTHPDIPLWSYAWFHCFSPSPFTGSFFYGFLSLSAFPLGYLLFRDLSGAKTALFGLFFWGMAQWPVTLTRIGHPVTSIPFYLTGALLFTRWAWTRSWSFAWVLAGFFLGLAFYAYPSARALLPLVVLISWFEFRSKPAGRPFPWTGAVLLLATFCW